MSNRLASKSAFVAGGAQGIGRSIVDAFARENASVLAADLRWDEGPLFSSVQTIVLDLTDADAVEDAARSWPDFDILVNCVGYVASGSILECPIELLHKSFATNVLSMTHAIRCILPGMLKRGAGSIINIASVVSSTKGAPDRFAYGTTKAAVLGLTKSVARDYVSSGIRCNSISPGTTRTPSLQQRLAATGNVEEARTAFVARQPMGRLGEPEEIAEVAVLLASDEARFMTGADIVIDGGMSL